jgi:predicted nucleic acid-binding protein
MAKYVVDAPFVLHLLREGMDVPDGHQLLAPTLLRSQVLDALYREVRSGEVSEEEGLGRLARFARMKIRYLGDKVLRREAWTVATRMGWPSTDDAEYVALTRLQADALVALGPRLAAEAGELVPTARLEDLL